MQAKRIRRTDVDPRVVMSLEPPPPPPPPDEEKAVVPWLLVDMDGNVHTDATTKCDIAAFQVHERLYDWEILANGQHTGKWASPGAESHATAAIAARRGEQRLCHQDAQYGWTGTSRAMDLKLYYAWWDARKIHDISRHMDFTIFPINDETNTLNERNEECQQKNVFKIQTQCQARTNYWMPRWRKLLDTADSLVDRFNTGALGKKGERIIVPVVLKDVATDGEARRKKMHDTEDRILVPYHGKLDARMRGTVQVVLHHRLYLRLNFSSRSSLREIKEWTDNYLEMDPGLSDWYWNPQGDGLKVDEYGQLRRPPGEVGTYD